jgi:ActR/RegA family two-component response regulator
MAMSTSQSKRDVTTVLVVDDAETFLTSMERALQRLGKRAYGASDGATAVSQARVLRPELALVDLVMPGRDGLWTVTELRKLDPQMFIVLYSGVLDPAHAMAAVRAGANDCLDKGTAPSEVLARVEYDRPIEPKWNSEPTLEQTIKNRVARALIDSDNNRTLAAERLAITRQGLQKMLKKWRG